MASIICEEKSSRLFLREMQKSTPAAKIRSWRSCLHGARILEVNGIAVSTVDDLAKAFLRLKEAGEQKRTILMAHSAIREGLVETGIPQINIDQLNNRHSLMSLDVMTQEQFDNWFSNLPRCFYELVSDGGVLNMTTESHKLTLWILLQQDDWKSSKTLQLDQYEHQFMFGTPVKPTEKSAVFNLIWTYLIKWRMDGRRPGAPVMAQLVVAKSELWTTPTLIASIKLDLDCFMLWQQRRILCVLELMFPMLLGMPHLANKAFSSDQMLHFENGG